MTIDGSTLRLPPGVESTPHADVTAAMEDERLTAFTAEEVDAAWIRPLVAGGPTESLSPEMMLIMLQQRLRGLDSQIAMETKGIQEAAKASEALSELIQGMAALRDAMAAKKKKSGDDVNLNTFAFTANGVEYNPAKSFLIEHNIQDLVEGTYDADGNLVSVEDHMTRDVIIGKIETLQLQQRTINSGNEMSMVRLQAAIGQRQQAIQLTTNLVQNMNQSCLDIIRNTK